MRRALIAASLILTPLLLAPLPRADGSVGSQPAPAAASVGSRSAPSLDAFWARAKQEVYRSPEELAAQEARELRKGLRYDKLRQGDPRQRAVALTFDDGPHPEFTLRLLAILEHYGVKATFFVVGEMAEKHPDLIRAEVAGGHLVANHTYHHANLTKIPEQEVLVELQACEDVVKSITGQTMRFARPPGGDYDAQVIEAAADLGLTTVLWTDDPGDYASPGDKRIESRVLDRIGAGGIILLHDGVQQTLNVLPQIIQRLQSRGYRFVTVAEMRGAMTARSAGRRPAAPPSQITGSRPLSSGRPRPGLPPG